MDFQKLNDGVPKGNILVIGVNSDVDKSFYIDIFKEDLKHNLKDMVTKKGPLPWPQFQRMASLAYGAGTVAKALEDKEFQEFIDSL